MPVLKFYNVNNEIVKDFAVNETSNLAQTINCPEDWLTFFPFEVNMIVNKEIVTNSCYIVIEWFKREKDVQDKVAKLITEYFKKNNFEEVVVNFVELSKENYYENMEQY